jgi:hypothetical protein
MRQFLKRSLSIAGTIMLPVLGLAALAGGGMNYMFAMPGTSYRGPLPELTAEEQKLAARLRQHVTAIAGEEHNVAHYRQLEQTARYIEKALAGYGYAIKRQEFAGEAGPVRNLEVSIPDAKGNSRPSKVVVVGAHYDSATGSPGANDNASGTAAVIELAGLLKNARLADGYELKLVLYVNEELPYFKSRQMGSWVHAQDLHARGQQVAGMLSLETMGYYSDVKGSQHYPSALSSVYPDRGNFIGFVGDLGSRALVHRVITSFRRHASFPSEGIAAPAAIPGIDWSDHWAYREFGYPALMVTDTAPYRYPYYHSAQDTPDKVDFAKLSRVVKGVEQVIRELVNPEQDVSH